MANMAKRSDFAQKLLDDLRLRKERMAASQNSKGSRSMAGDAYAYSKHTYRGSREMKTRQANGVVKGGTMHDRSSGGNKSLTIEDASKQIVPFGRGRSSEQIGDLSMALAFALENGGKLRRMDSSGNSSMLGFLHQIGRRSVEVGNLERSSADRHHLSNSRFPTLSHLHINEISKGAQKLNQILRACSNGLNFDIYSIEIGKELLKGAMDLEESLRMLVNLQEASENMIRPQSKTQITLLDDDEDDDDNTLKTVEHNQLDRPRFSFDKPSRNSRYIQEVARTDLRQRLMALTYPSESTHFNHGTHAFSTSNSVPHKQSISHGSNVKTLTAFSEQKNHSRLSKSKPEKGRIPNVIGKLMGLEELPGNEDSKYTQKELRSKQKTEGMITNKSEEGRSTQERKKKDAEKLVPTMRTQKQMQANNIQVIQDTTYGLQAEKNLATHHASFEVIIHDGKPSHKEVEGIKPTRGSYKANMKIDKHQSSTAQSNQSKRSQKESPQKERKQDNTKIREQKGKEKGETKDMRPKHELQHMAPQSQNRSDDAIKLQRQVECNASTLKMEMRDGNGHLSNNQPESLSDLGFQQPYMLRKFGPEDIKHHAGESEQKSAKQNIQVRKQKGSEEMPGSLATPIHDSLNLQKRHPHVNQATHGIQSKGFPINRHQEDLVQDRSSTNFNINVQDSMNRNSNQNFSTRDLKSDRKEKGSIPQPMEEKPVHPPAIRKVKNTKVQKVETPRKIDELMTGRSRTPHGLARPQKHQNSILQEVKQQKRNKLGGSKAAEQARAIRSKEAEARIVKSHKSVASIQQSHLLGELQMKSEQASNFYSPPVDNECQSPKGPQITAPRETHQNIISTGSDDQQGQKLDLGRGEFGSHKIVLDALNGTCEGSRDITYPSQLRDQKVSKLETPEPLTESENHLKQILIKSQLFLNTAEALFNLNIPFAILHGSGHDYPDQERKLILDCGYEVMKRKGKRQELSIYPFITISITSPKTRSLDDLIKQLHKDFKKLKFYGRNDNVECVVEDYLPKILESDVNTLDPDVNCMWDFGWSMLTLAVLEKDDVVRDVEKFVLNGLLDEVARDLLPVF